MTVSESAAYATYARETALPDLVGTLNRAGFENEDICMVLSPGHPLATVVRDARIVDSNVKGSSVGARMIGCFSKLGAVVIPTVGFFIRSQAFFRALMLEPDFSPLYKESLCGESLCGESKTLAGLGFSFDEAKRLAYQLGDVGALVYVACRERARADRASEVLRHAGAREASVQAGGMPHAVAAVA